MRSTHNSFVFLDGHAKSGGQFFAHPKKIITSYDANQVPVCLEEIQNEIDAGNYVAGFFAYECGYALEERLRKMLPIKRETPLLWFGVFDTPEHIPFARIDQWLEKRQTGTHKVVTIHPSISQEEYATKFNKVKEYISAGDIYQANLTFKGHFNFDGCPVSFYRNLRHGQQTDLGGLISTGEETYLSLSPELFFSSKEGVLTCRPMKGTAKRGLTISEDDRIKEWLQRDEKSQAENLMIVDLMRNDMSRISKPGSVSVNNLYKIETYPTLHQMTSEITSTLKENASISDIIKNIFPCGSVTGAPKLRAMEIIHELENKPRGIYTGAIGVFEPNGNTRFNVAIRTLKLKDNKGEIGIGSGLVADSNAGEEYAECLLKMKFLQEPQPAFDLLETMRWNKEEGYLLLDHHLDRLAQSATYFDFPCNRNQIEETLAAYMLKFSGKDQRVRLLLNKIGEITLTHTELPDHEQNRPWKFAVSKKTVNSKDPFFYHKTTNRLFYDDEREKLKAQTGCDEVIFLNEKGEITEGSFTNIFVRIEGRLLTPARICGLLDGTYRRYLLERDDDPAREAILTINDLQKADDIYLGNSVRGMIKASPILDLIPA